jgi:hypothetical protein
MKDIDPIAVELPLKEWKWPFLWPFVPFGPFFPKVFLYTPSRKGTYKKKAKKAERARKGQTQRQ